MSKHDWHVLASFGLLTAALGMYDSQLALAMVGVATAVVLIRNADKVGEVLHT